MITTEEFAGLYPKCPEPAKFAAAISEGWARFGFTSRAQKAGFLAIAAAETGGFTSVKRELMLYSAARGNEVFGDRGVKCQHLAPLDNAGRRIRTDAGRAYASCVYEGMYGNGGRSTEDGWNYRGGGIVQLTFISAYEAASTALRVDLVSNPDRIVEPEISALAACWFMAKYKPDCLKLLAALDEATFLRAALLVGRPADKAATARRLEYRRAAMKVVKDDEPRPVATSKTVLATATGAATTTAAGQFGDAAAAPIADVVRDVLPQAMSAAVTPGLVKWVLVGVALVPLLYVAVRYVRKVFRGEATVT